MLEEIWLLVESKEVKERTHRDHRPTGVAAVEAEGHHVGLLVYLTRAGLVIEVQGRIVEAFFLQKTTDQSN